MKKILHLGQLVGGLDVYIRNVIAYSSDEFEYIVVHGKKDNSKPIFKNLKLIKEYKINLYRNLNPIYDFVCIVQAIMIIIKEKPDIIHCHSAKGGVVGRIVGFLTKTNTLYTPHAFSFLATENRLKRTIFLLIERTFKFNSFLLACSVSEQELGKTEVKYKQIKALVWQNSVPDASKICEDSNIDINDKYVCYIGRPSYQKNTFFLVDVVKNIVKENPDFKLYLLGVGYHSPDLITLKDLILKSHLSKNIILIDWLPQNETFLFLKKSLFYISCSRYEGLPLSILEAMSLSKPIVASRVTGNIDCVQNEYNGFLLPLDVDVFSKKILDLWNDIEKQKYFSINSRLKYINEFNIKNQIIKLESNYLNY